MRGGLRDVLRVPSGAAAMRSESCWFDSVEARRFRPRRLLLHRATRARAPARCRPARYRPGRSDSDRGSFAQQPQNHGTGSFDGLLGFAHSRQNLDRAPGFFDQAGAQLLHLLLERRRGFRVSSAFRFVPLCQAGFEVAGLLVGARHALLDAGGFAHLGFQTAFGALGLHVHLRELRRALR